MSALFGTASWDYNRLKEVNNEEVKRLEISLSASCMVLQPSNMPNIEELLLSLKRIAILFCEDDADAGTGGAVMTWFPGIVKRSH